MSINALEWSPFAFNVSVNALIRPNELQRSITLNHVATGENNNEK